MRFSCLLPFSFALPFSFFICVLLFCLRLISLICVSYFLFAISFFFLICDFYFLFSFSFFNLRFLVFVFVFFFLFRVLPSIFPCGFLSKRETACSVRPLDCEQSLFCSKINNWHNAKRAVLLLLKDRYTNRQPPLRQTLKELEHHPKPQLEVSHHRGINEQL